MKTHGTDYTAPSEDVDQEVASSEHPTEDERVDEAIDESFPASDPPSWNSGLEHYDSTS